MDKVTDTEEKNREMDRWTATDSSCVSSGGAPTLADMHIYACYVKVKYNIMEYGDGAFMA